MAARHQGLASRLYRGEISYDFIGHRKRWYAVSGALILLSVALLGGLVALLGNFSLRGGHRTVACDTCHVGEHYKEIGTACVDCHKAQDVHVGIEPRVLSVLVLRDAIETMSARVCGAVIGETLPIEVERRTRLP